jgi:alpha-tubulin suppressor-like RCC1 family protein
MDLILNQVMNILIRKNPLGHLPRFLVVIMIFRSLVTETHQSNSLSRLPVLRVPYIPFFCTFVWEMNFTPAASSLTYHFLLVNEEDHLMAWGSNESGSLGIGDKDARNTPTRVHCEYITPGDEIVEAGFGVRHTVLLTKNNLLLLSGINDEGEMGRGEGEDSVEFHRLDLSGRVKTIATAALSTYAITEDGVFSWGDNEYGQLGLGDRIVRHTPHRISGLPENIVSLSGGHQHVLAVTAGGALYGWGRNDSGELGLGTEVDQLLPIAHPQFTADVVQVCCGSSQTFLVNSSGELWSWGWNGNVGLGRGLIPDQLCPGLTMEGVAEVVSGSSHCIARLRDGSFVVWGNNGHGQLGLGDESQRLFPTPFIFPPEFPGGSEGVAAFGTGCYNSYMLNFNGGLWVWGDSDEGKLGIEPLRHLNVPHLLKGHKWKLPGRKMLQKFQAEYWEVTFKWLFQGKLSRACILCSLPTEVLFHMVGVLYEKVVGFSLK